MKDKQSKRPSRMETDVNKTSRTMQPDAGKEGKTNALGSTPASSSSQKGQGRGWHGDSEGHAKAGSQSHKNTDKGKF